MNREVIVTQHSKGQLGPSLPPFLCLWSTFPEDFFLLRWQCYYLPPLITILQLSKKYHQCRWGSVVRGKLVSLVLSERVAATWSKEHLIRLIISLQTILPETATAATCLSIPFQEFQSLVWLLWKLTTRLPKEYIIPMHICLSSLYGYLNEGCRHKGWRSMEEGGWLDKTSQRVLT